MDRFLSFEVLPGRYGVQISGQGKKEGVWRDLGLTIRGRVGWQAVKPGKEAVGAGRGLV
jgi:hypothetical protein